MTRVARLALFRAVGGIADVLDIAAVVAAYNAFVMVDVDAVSCARAAFQFTFPRCVTMNFAPLPTVPRICAPNFALVGSSTTIQRQFQRLPGITPTHCGLVSPLTPPVEQYPHPVPVTYLPPWFVDGALPLFCFVLFTAGWWFLHARARCCFVCHFPRVCCTTRFIFVALDLDGIVVRCGSGWMVRISLVV